MKKIIGKVNRNLREDKIGLDRIGACVTRACPDRRQIGKEIKAIQKKIFLIIFASFIVSGMGGEAGAVRTGGTFNFCAPHGGDLFGLDPHRSTRTQDFLVGMNIHRSLFKWDADSNKPVPDLIQNMEVSEDGIVWKIRLKPNVKFHNGRTLTADDVIWSYNRIVSPKTSSPSARYIRPIQGAADVEAGRADRIEGLRKIDAHALEITLESAVDLPFSLFETGTAILPREEIEAKGNAFGLEPVGCGPFKFVKWVKGSEVILEKFPDFYEKGKPYLDKVVYKIMGEGAARDIAFRAKELDATLVGAAQYPVYKQDPKISRHMVEVAEMYTRLIGFNPGYKPFSSKLVRQAINHAIDAPLIVRKIAKEKAYPAVGYLPTTSSAFDPEAKGYEYNPGKALELMKKAGYEKGFTFECLTTINEGAPVVEAIMPFLKKINITVVPQLMEGAALADRTRKGEFQAVILAAGSGPDPLQALRRFDSRNPRTAQNYFLYNNPEFDRLLDDASRERDEKKRNALLIQADAMLRGDAPVWFFNYNKAVIAFQPWVHGIKPVAVEMMYQDLAGIWVEATSPRAKE